MVRWPPRFGTVAAVAFFLRRRRRYCRFRVVAAVALIRAVVVISVTVFAVVMPAAATARRGPGGRRGRFLTGRQRQPSLEDATTQLAIGIMELVRPLPRKLGSAWRHRWCFDSCWRWFLEE
jgi:hypothetical protein